MTATQVMEAVRSYVDRGVIPGAVVGVWRDGELSMTAAGSTHLGGGAPMSPDTLVRISSNTKPLVAALAMVLVDDGVLALEDVVERFVPELSGRRVLRQLDSPLNDTVPAQRLATVEDLLTMRFGFGFVFEEDCPALSAAASRGLGIGPPDPSLPLSPDAWIARFAELPLLEQPGATWRYDLAYAVLGVVLARAAGRPLGELLRERLLDPLGMADTSFGAPPGRLPPCYAVGESGLVLFDDAAASRWSTTPSFPDGRGGLVSTAGDLLRFASSLLDGGGGVLSPHSVSAMTSDDLTPEQRRGPSALTFLGGSGWGTACRSSPRSTTRRCGWRATAGAAA